MSIVVNTNVQSLMVQRSLTSATNKMNTAMERMSTGLKINAAKDDAAGMAVSTKMETQINASKIAQDNAQIGSSLLTTTEGTLGVIQSNLQRIRDLSEQAANETYDETSKEAIITEIKQRTAEITRLAKTADFNGIKLLDASKDTDLLLQVGTGSKSKTATDTDDENTIAVSKDVFKSAAASSLGQTAGDKGVQAVFDKDDSSDDIRTYMGKVDLAITDVTKRMTLIGAAQNRLESAVESLTVLETNLSASNSLIKDADIAEESSNFVKQQILQQSSASLLVQANQTPSIALSLIGG